MATAEAAPASLGPRFAPDDPTLPKPWKGLIDGSTGLLYYWNPETNITQYERPVSLPPPLPPGPPPAASTPKLAPIPMARTFQQPNGVLGQQGQQMTQVTAQSGQQIAQGIQQQQLIPQQHVASGQQQAQQAAQATQQQSQMTPAVQQQPQMAQAVQQQPQMAQAVQQQPQMTQAVQQQPQMTQAVLQQGQLMQHQFRPQMVQQVPQMPQQLGQQTPQHQGQQMPHQPGQQFQYQHLQQMSYQQTPHPQGSQHLQQPAQQGAHQQGPQIPQQQAQQIGSQQGQPISQQQTQQNTYQQGQKMGFIQEETEYQQGKQIGISTSQIQQAGTSSLHSLPTGTHSMQTPQIGARSVHAQQFGSPAVSAQQTGSPLVQMPQIGMDPVLRQQMGGPMVGNQMGPSVIPNQQAGGPSTGLKIEYENPRGRAGNDLYHNANKEGTSMVSQPPGLTTIPMGRNQQGVWMDGVPPQRMTPGHAGGPNIMPGHAMPNMYHHAAVVPPFPSNAPLRPASRMFGSVDAGNLSPAEVYRRQHEVTATGDNVPAPFMTFEATGFPPEILREIHLAGFSSPTPIQAQTWPIALQSRDIVAIAKTGSGKTLGYLIPAFIHLRQCQNNPQNGPTVVVLAPTRELATQIQDEAIKFGRSSHISCTCLYGGAPKGPQLRDLDRGADIVVATPGRLNDILEMRKIDFRQVSLLVLDEADRMLDMGFEPQIRKIVNEIPPRRQTLMYTATWPKEVRKIAGDLLVNPVQVNIGTVNELVANKAITQYVEVVPQMEKQRRLEQILRAQERGSKIIIFCSTKRLCDQLARSIGRNFGAIAIHGDKSQGERDWVLNQFRSGKSPILVATDVAARGLDIKDIRVVINYDFPTGVEDYVHRIGRTGRAGATGVSYTFFSDQDWKYATDLVKVLEGSNQRVPPELREMALRGGPSFGKGRGGMNRWESSSARWDSGGRGGTRDGGFGGRGGMRDGGFGGRGGRNETFGGRGNRGRGFGPGGGASGRGRYDRAPYDRRNNMDGRGRYDNRRGIADRSRGRSYSRSYSPSPERVRTWDYSRSRSRSRSRSKSRSWSRSRSRSRSFSRSRSRSFSRSRSQSQSRSQSKSHSYDRYQRENERDHDQITAAPDYGAPPESPMSPGTQGGSFPGIEPVAPEMLADGSGPIYPVNAVIGAVPSFQPVNEP